MAPVMAGVGVGVGGLVTTRGWALLLTCNIYIYVYTHL